METMVRIFKPGEESELLTLLAEAHGNHYDAAETRRVSSSARFDPAGCFIAEEQATPVGCVAVTKLPRDKWFVIRYLAIRNAQSRVQVAQRLLERAVQHVRSQGPEYVRATTPAIEPYVTVYKDAGFSPVRKDFRIAWDLDAQGYGSSGFDISELQPEMTDEAAEPYVRTLSPYWDWRTEEQGGPGAVTRSFKEETKHGERWLLCRVNGTIVGLAGLIPDHYGSGRARSRGASVLPEYRCQGIGSALMHEILNFAKRLRQDKMTVYTFSYLGRLAPGASLYLRSGGRIEAEYLQLQM
jgi:N-acetylglutamate synthase-like GNAT family acetyltransferase